MSSPRFVRMPLACMLALGLLPLVGSAQKIDEASSDSRLCAADAKISAAQDLALYYTSEGLRLLQVPAEELAAELAKSAVADCGLKATTANLSIEFPGQAAALTGGPVSFFNPSKTMDVVDPVLCHSYTSVGLTIALGDTNGLVQTTGGWASVAYDLGTRRLRPVALPGDRGPLAQCFSFPFAQLTGSPNEFPGEAGPGPDAIFRGRFERLGDLAVEMRAADTNNVIGKLNVSAGFDFTYALQVTNFGEAPVSGIVVREFVPEPMVSPIIEPVVETVSWTCARGDGSPCATPSGTSAISATGETLAKGQFLRYSITRRVPSGTAGERTLMAAGAFVDPSHSTGAGEQNFADNSAELVLELLDNQPPTIACAEGATALANPVAMSEDGASKVYSCTVTDPDATDTVASFAVKNTSSFGPLQAFGTVDGTAGDDVWTFTLAPTPNANGTATIVLEAVDSRGASRALQFDVNVAAVNDAPSFSVLSSQLDVFTDGSDPDGVYNGGVLCSAAPSGFNCEAAVLDFFFGFAAGGGADEAGQSVQPALNALGTIDAANCGINTPGENVSGFFARLPEILPATATPVADNPKFALRFIYKTTATGSVFCDFRFTDSGGASSAPVRVTFTIQAPPAA